MSEEPLKDENFKLKKQLKLNHKLAKMLYDKLNTMLYINQEDKEEKEGKEALDNIMNKLTEDYNKLDIQ